MVLQNTPFVTQRIGCSVMLLPQAVESVRATVTPFGRPASWAAIGSLFAVLGTNARSEAEAMSCYAKQAWMQDRPRTGRPKRASSVANFSRSHRRKKSREFLLPLETNSPPMPGGESSMESGFRISRANGIFSHPPDMWPAS